MEHHPSALRNRQPITEQLQKLIQSSPDKASLALEIASGTGAHLELFANTFPGITWQPSEYLVDSNLPEGDLGRIGTRSDGILETLDSVGSKFSNVLPAIHLDVSKQFPDSVNNQSWDLVLICNVLHISPIECTHGLLSGAGTILKENGHLVVYGPFKIKGAFTGDGGNEKFDASLKERNPAWGYRDVEYIEEIAEQHGLVLVETTQMPANNFMLTLRKKVAEKEEGEEEGEEEEKVDPDDPFNDIDALRSDAALDGVGNLPG